MNIQFIQDEGTLLAIANDCIFKKQHCDEVWFAEIYPKNNKFIVFWEEDFTTKYEFSTLEEARGYILNNYLTKTPLIMGNREDI